MAVHNIEIGNQIFEIICQEGEEDYLNAAAQILDTEAQMVVQNSDRIGEKRMLLMAGLMLADRMAGVQERLDRLEKDSNQREMALEEQNSAEAEAAALRSDIEEKDSEIADLQNA
ncbi:MAG: cell division protein ZapA, partial [Pseudomonadota bacterium]